jgi:uridylate kinase
LINKKLEVIDLTSAAMCDENDIDMVLFDMNVKGNILRAANNEPIGTMLSK